MNWRANSPATHLSYQTPYMVRLKDGTECEAMRLKLNKHCGKREVWKRLDDVPRKQRYVEPEDVTEVRSAE